MMSPGVMAGDVMSPSVMTDNMMSLVSRLVTAHLGMSLVVVQPSKMTSMLLKSNTLLSGYSVSNQTQ